jgi:phospholipid/cholesterol/gamma-HCH transport system substrate-binding protein
MTPRAHSHRLPPGQRRPWSRFRVGLLAIVLILVASYFGFAKDIPFTHGYRLHAVFESSNNLRPGSPVRIAGVNVGKVASVARYRETDLTEVTLEIDEAGLPIHRDATLKIRPRIFLEGNFFVDLKPGSPSAPEVRDGGTIGPAQTSPPVQLDQLLTALQADTREDLQIVLQEYGASLNSKPTAEEDADQDPLVRGLTGAEALNRSYRYSPDALRGATLVNSALLGTEPHDLSRMFSGIARLTTALRSKESELQELIGNFNTTAGSFAAQSASLQRAIGLLGPTLTTAEDAFRSLDLALPATREFARAFTPAVRETPATVQAAFPWLEQTRLLLRRSELRGLLAELQPATEDLARLQAATMDFLPQLDLANRCFAEVVIPAGNIGVEDGALTTRRPDGSIVENFKEFWHGMVGLAGEGAGFDGNGSYIRAGVGGGEHVVRAGRSRLTGGTVIGATNLRPLGTSPLAPDEKLPYNRTFPCHRNPLPNVNGPQAGPGSAPDSFVRPTPPPEEPPAPEDDQ